MNVAMMMFIMAACEAHYIPKRIYEKYNEIDRQKDYLNDLVSDITDEFVDKNLDDDSANPLWDSEREKFLGRNKKESLYSSENKYLYRPRIICELFSVGVDPLTKKQIFILPRGREAMVRFAKNGATNKGRKNSNSSLRPICQDALTRKELNSDEAKSIRTFLSKGNDFFPSLIALSDVKNADAVAEESLPLTRKSLLARSLTGSQNINEKFIPLFIDLFTNKRAELPNSETKGLSDNVKQTTKSKDANLPKYNTVSLHSENTLHNIQTYLEIIGMALILIIFGIIIISWFYYKRYSMLREDIRRESMLRLVHTGQTVNNMKEEKGFHATVKGILVKPSENNLKKHSKSESKYPVCFKDTATSPYIVKSPHLYPLPPPIPKNSLHNELKQISNKLPESSNYDQIYRKAPYSSNSRPLLSEIPSVSERMNAPISKLTSLDSKKKSTTSSLQEMLHTNLREEVKSTQNSLRSKREDREQRTKSSMMVKGLQTKSQK